MSTPRLRARFLAAAGGLVLTTVAVSPQVSDVRSADAAHGYSPLNQINRQNVHQLQLVWSWTLHHETTVPAPLVSEGIMSIPGPGGGVQALDAVTGDLLWDLPGPPQVPGEVPDADESLERVLVDDNGRSSVFSMSPAGILWEHDRTTGAYRAAYDLGYQNTVTLDPTTGAVIERSQAVARGSTRPLSCPGPPGFKSRRAMAFHPGTHALYVPLTLHCIEDGNYQFHPSWPEGLGEFAAIDIRTRRILWRHRTRAPMSSAALVTGGGLVIAGDSDRHLYIHDAANGRILYRTRLPNAARGFPITYTVRGRQYLAVPASAGSTAGWADVATRLTPDVKAAADANTIHVFALPDGAK